MKIFLRQIYVEQGAECPFSNMFQRCITAELSSLVVPGSWFSAKYGDDWKLIFNISARWSLDENDTDSGVKRSDEERVKLARYRSFTSEPLRVELRGPTVFRKDKDVEYSIFLPFRRIVESEAPPVSALDHIFAGIYSVLEKMQIDTSRLRDEQDRIVGHICAEPMIFKISPHPESGIGPPVWSVISKN